MDHLAVIRHESALFLDAVRAADPTARVPACPDWDARDLAFHLGEVQSSWARSVGPVPGAGLPGDDAPQVPRPDDDALPAFVADGTARLVAALDGRDHAEACWSWHPDGGSVGWVARRQAHEVLIHRVDAEQTAGRPVTGVDDTLAADGVDEVLRVMVDGLPDWATFTPDGTGVVLTAQSARPRSWVLALGRFTGVGPQSGTRFDEDCAQLVGPDAAPVDVARVVGDPWALDRWLWGRGDLDGLRVDGDEAVVARFRTAVAEATQ